MELIKLIFKTRDVTKFPEYPIFENEQIWIGRCKDKDSIEDIRDLIQIESRTVSHRHALISHVKNIRTGENEFWLEDHSRYHTTFLNGVRIQQPVRLKDKDQITFGEILTFVEFQEINQPDDHYISQTIQNRKETTTPIIPVEKITSPQGMPVIDKINRELYQQHPTSKLKNPNASQTNAIPAHQDTVFRDSILAEPISDEELQRNQSGGKTTSNFPRGDTSWLKDGFRVFRQEPLIEGAEAPIPLQTIINPPNNPPGVTTDQIKTVHTSIPPISPPTKFETIPPQIKAEISPTIQIIEEKFQAELIFMPSSKYATKIAPLGDATSWFIYLNDTQEPLFVPNAENTNSLSPNLEGLQLKLESLPEQVSYQLTCLSGQTCEVRINGPTVELPYPLKDGDLIQCGSHSLYFFDGSNGDYSPLQHKIHASTQNEIPPSILPFIEPVKMTPSLEGRAQIGYRIFGHDPETLAFFSRSTEHGHYLFWGDVLTGSPNYRFMPWLQGMFDLIVDDVESCVQILRKLNTIIIQTCNILPVRATLLRLTKTDIAYCSAQGNNLILHKSDGSQEIFTTHGMMLGLSKEIFLEESPTSLQYQPEQAFVFSSHSYFDNITQTSPQKYLSQKDLQDWIQEATRQHGMNDLLNSLAYEIEKNVQIKTPFLIGVVNFPPRPKRCPQCAQTFPSTYKVCPYDQAILEY